jgi:rSAM/selenodomain-associated transferase 2
MPQDPGGEDATGGVSRPQLSIIIPALNEATQLPRLLADLAVLRARGAEIIVVDGGSVDETRVQARDGADRVLSSPAGRALQMNVGADAAAGAAFWFLHADTRVSAAVIAAVSRLPASGYEWGRFRVRLSGRRPMFRVIAAMMNLRSCLSGVATGDQGLWVTRDAFRQIGGFPEIPLMEDIELSRRLKRAVGRPACVKAALVTSSRRWEECGLWRTVFLMWRLRLAYWAGADPAALARRYP